MIQQKIFLARQKKASEIQHAARAGFLKGIKAAAKAAGELVKEGVAVDDQFEGLVLKRVRQARIQTDTAEGQEPPTDAPAA